MPLQLLETAALALLGPLPLFHGRFVQQADGGVQSFRDGMPCRDTWC